MSSQGDKSAANASRGPASGGTTGQATNEAASAPTGSSNCYDDTQPAPTEPLPSYETATLQNPPPYTPVDIAPLGAIPYSEMIPFANPDLNPIHRSDADLRDPMSLTDAEINAITSPDLLDFYIDTLSRRVFGVRPTTVQEAAILAKLRHQKRLCLQRESA